MAESDNDETERLETEINRLNKLLSIERGKRETAERRAWYNLEQKKVVERTRDKLQAHLTKSVDEHEAAVAKIEEVERERREAEAALEYQRDVVQAYCDSENAARADLALAQESLGVEHKKRQRAEAQVVAMRVSIEEMMNQCESVHDDGACTSPCTICEIARAALATDAGKTLLAELVQLRERRMRLLVALGLDTPYPLPSVLRHLIDATRHMLQTHNCDADGWEVWKTACDAAPALLRGLDAAMANHNAPAP